MTGISKSSLILSGFLFLACLSIHAQTDQLLPEVDAYGKLSSDLRVWFQAKGTREDGAPLQAEIGPSLDFYLKPFLHLKGATEFDLDDSKSRPFVFSVGYRYLPQANGAPSTNRMEPVVTFNFPVKGKILFSDRNRGDLDWQNGGFTWRYRNRIQFEKTMRVRLLTTSHPTPAPSFTTPANTPNGATLPSMSDVFSPFASTSNSTRTTNTRTAPARAPTSSTTS